MAMIDVVELEVRAELEAEARRKRFKCTLITANQMLFDNITLATGEKIGGLGKLKRRQYREALNGVVINYDYNLRIDCDSEDDACLVYDLKTSEFIGRITKDTKLIIEDKKYFIVPNNWFREGEQPVKEET